MLSLWLDWWVFCDCGFQFACPLMEKEKRLMEASWLIDWLRGKLGLALMGGAILSKSLIQFSVYGWSCVPSLLFQFSTAQSLSPVQFLETAWITARQASLSITTSQSLLKLMSIESVKPSSHLILCRPLLLLPPIPPSIGVFSNESTLPMRWPKYWSFSFSITLYNEHPELISFRMGWLDLLAVQGTLKSLLQHHS